MHDLVTKKSSWLNTLHWYFCCFTLLMSTLLFSQTFEQVAMPDLRGGYQGYSAFVDYNNDGFLDIFVTGVDFDMRFNNAVLYENNGDSSFTESTIINIPRVINGDYSWADFDNNGTQDLLYSGTTSGFSDRGITKIFKNINDGCEFIELAISLPGMTGGVSRWVDIDNDGLLDIFLAGYNINNEFDIAMFKNQGNDTFIPETNSTINVILGGRGNLTKNQARWSDLDGDGLEDLILASSSKTDFNFEVYKNLGGFQFEKRDIGLPRLSYVAMEVGDMNNDNLPDIVFTGSPKLENLTGDGTGDLYVFVNNGAMSFTNSHTIVNEGVLDSDIELGDINNDNFLDVVNYGTGPWGTFPQITKIYTNDTNGGLTTFAHNLPNCRFGGVEFGDFDNDNDTDILYYGRISDPGDTEITYIYENKLLNIDVPSDILAKASCVCDNSMSFTLDNETDAIQWTFGDPATGALNNYSGKKATHVFSNDGNFTISATYTIGAITNTITKTIAINGLPIITQPTNIPACSNVTVQSYDFNSLKDDEIRNGASAQDFELFYYTSYDNAENDSHRISMPYTHLNTLEKIYARVQSTSNSECFLVSDFDIVPEQAPFANPIQNIAICDTDTDGFAQFDLTTTTTAIEGGEANVRVDYYSEQQQLIPNPDLINYQNAVVDTETITARLVHTTTGCYSETTFNLVVQALPIANTLADLIGCDENNDGISEFFDTSEIAASSIGNQSGMEISYYDTNGNLRTPLSNPYTNTTPYEEHITVRITNSTTLCYSETQLILRTSERPQINAIADLYSCDTGEGFGVFDTTTLENDIIGNQPGLLISYTDANGQIIPDFINNSFINQTPNQQEINVRVTSQSNPSCYSDTNFSLLVNMPIEVAIESDYSLCFLEPDTTLEIASDFDSYAWNIDDGDLISNSNSVVISQEGDYILTVTKIENGISCEKQYDFSLIRSDAPKIEEVLFTDFANDNRIEIIASGEGDFEYSIDGNNFKDTSIFEKVAGGTYTVFVRDKNGCGEDSKEVILLDYPRFFTPNNDGINDFWQILGANDYPEASITIYDRYGKLLHQFSVEDKGWNGTYDGNHMPASDYWFRIDFATRKSFTAHFTLKR